MTAVWKQGSTSRDWSAAYRGLTFRIKVDPETAKATEISWYISGKVEMVSPVRATVVVATRIATKVIDHQIASEGEMASSGDPVSARAFPQAMSVISRWRSCARPLESVRPLR